MEKDKKVYAVTYNGVLIFENENVINACGFALELHKVCNVPHELKVAAGEDMVLRIFV